MPPDTPPDASGLDRFLDAQATSLDLALAEIRAGRKRSHWIWYVFPQIAGLGRSDVACHYAITGLSEARAYWAHPVLGARLRASVAAMNSHVGPDAAAILGEVDAMKFRSCLTLFLQADPAAPELRAALDRFFGGRPDAATLALLAGGGESGPAATTTPR